jgi:hypothetical protein
MGKNKILIFSVVLFLITLIVFSTIMLLSKNNQTIDITEDERYMFLTNLSIIDNKDEFIEFCLSHNVDDEYYECIGRTTDNTKICNNIIEQDYKEGCIFNTILYKSQKSNKNFCFETFNYELENKFNDICNFFINDNYVLNCDSWDDEKDTCNAINLKDISFCESNECIINFQINSALKENDTKFCEKLDEYEYDCISIVNPSIEICEEWKIQKCNNLFYDYFPEE